MVASICWRKPSEQNLGQHRIANRRRLGRLHRGLCGRRLAAFSFSPSCSNRYRAAGLSKMAQMAHFLEQAYALFVTRVVRKPKTAAAARVLAPIWLCAPDLPVYKRQKQSLRDVVVNDGLHFHVILLLPPWSRLWDVVMHFEELRPIYRQRAALDRVDVEPIMDRHRYVQGYGWKSILKGRFDVGDGFVLPRALSELAGIRHTKGKGGPQPSLLHFVATFESYPACGVKPMLTARQTAILLAASLSRITRMVATSPSSDASGRN